MKQGFLKSRKTSLIGNSKSRSRSASFGTMSDAKRPRVDMLVGSRLLTTDETAADAGLSPESDVTVVLKQNAATCSHKGEFDRFGYEIDRESAFGG